MFVKEDLFVLNPKFLYLFNLFLLKLQIILLTVKNIPYLVLVHLKVYGL
jgi:hypothetical protein